MLCYLCEGGPVRLANIHDACKIEFKRRAAAGLCVRCGQNEANGVWCGGCGTRTIPSYSGYPGI